MSYLVYRHGSNAANQSMTPVAAVAIVNAADLATAREVAAENINCYANQHLELMSECDLTDAQLADWNAVVERDAQLLSVGEESIIY